jgi:hypothetical protein
MSYVNRIENTINSFSPKSNGQWSSELVLTITELVKLLNEVKKDKGIESLIYHGACYKVLSFSLQYLCAPLTNMPPQVLIIGIEGLDYGNNLFEELDYSRNILSKLELNDERSQDLYKKIDLLFSQFKQIHGYSDGGCYIATMVYDDYNHPQVIKLRRFRDDVLLKTLIGVLFVKLYYKYSPSFVKRIKGYHSINIVFKKILDAIIYFIK